MDAKSRPARVTLFPACDRDGLLLDALERDDDGPATRADALLFAWLLGLGASVDAVGAARAVLAVAERRGGRDTEHRRALIDGLERFVADDGRVASLSSVPASAGNARTRRR